MRKKTLRGGSYREPRIWFRSCLTTRPTLRVGTRFFIHLKVTTHTSVLEMFGLSFVLAIFSVKVTGNGTTVRGGDSTYDDGCRSLLGDGCGVYAWWFILFTMPVAVTVSALLLLSSASESSRFDNLLANIPASSMGVTCGVLGVLFLLAVGQSLFGTRTISFWW